MTTTKTPTNVSSGERAERIEHLQGHVNQSTTTMVTTMTGNNDTTHSRPATPKPVTLETQHILGRYYSTYMAAAAAAAAAATRLTTTLSYSQ